MWIDVWLSIKRIWWEKVEERSYGSCRQEWKENDVCGRDVEVKVASGDENIWLGG